MLSLILFSISVYNIVCTSISLKIDVEIQSMSSIHEFCNSVILESSALMHVQRLLASDPSCRSMDSTEGGLLPRAVGAVLWLQTLPFTTLTQ